MVLGICSLYSSGIRDKQLYFLVFSMIAAAPVALAQGSGAAEIETVVVTAERSELIGTAATSSQGVVTQTELAQLPVIRPGQLLETVPGLTVTSHSGEGKANQYLLRGFNLDHGTDLGVFVDNMPINEPSHAHGQGYTDLNFLIPEITAGLDFTKGPYYADEGDFSTVGSVHTRLVDTIPDAVSTTIGTLGYQRGFASGAFAAGYDTILAAGELVHYDGPWTHPDNFRKASGMLRYVHGDQENGFSLTGLYYRGLWNSTTDQPVRALTQGLIGRFGSLDPSDGGQAQRMSLTGRYHADLGGGHLDANLYVVNNRLTLWNDFTHFLDDPVNGDQEGQNELRRTFGGAVSYTQSATLWGVENDFLAGFSNRYDQNHVFRDHTRQRVFLSVFEDDSVTLDNAAGYAQATSHWFSWFRTVMGLREDYITGSDHGTNEGSANQSLSQPKASLIFTPTEWLEVYFSAGQGFHSDDLRGVNQAAALHIAGAPLIAKQQGEEAGLRANILPSLTVTLTSFYLKSQSETTYDPDAGQDGAGPGSRRTGLELNTTWQALSWLEIYTTIATSHARFVDPTDDGNGGHVGEYIPDAPGIIGSLAAYVRGLNGWSGALEYRYLGVYPVVPDDSIKGQGYGEWNLDASYQFENGWSVGAGLYNALDTKAYAAEFYYADRLPGEPAAGVGDLHVHPIEPRTVRITLGKLL